MPPLMLPISVREAIRDAVAAFGTPGEVPLASTATHEAIMEPIKAGEAAACRLAELRPRRGVSLPAGSGLYRPDTEAGP